MKSLHKNKFKVEPKFAMIFNFLINKKNQLLSVSLSKLKIKYTNRKLQ